MADSLIFIERMVKGFCIICEAMIMKMHRDEPEERKPIVCNNCAFGLHWDV